MDRNELITCLIEQPRAIQAAESALLEVEEIRRHLLHGLENQEADLLVQGVINGKNEAVRVARLKQLTDSQRALLVELERRQAAAKLARHRRQNEEDEAAPDPLAKALAEEFCR